MKVLQVLGGALLVLGGAYFFGRGLWYGSFLPVPLLFLIGGLVLIATPALTRSALRPSVGHTQAKWIGRALLLAAVVWAAISSTRSDSVLVVWGGAAVLGSLGAAFLLWHEVTGFRQDIRSLRDKDRMD